MKRILLYFATFVLILVLVILYTNERTDRKHYENETDKWKSIATMEQKIPSINEKAKKFVNALNRGEHKKYLTGTALKEYEDALAEGFEVEESEFESSSTSLQDMTVLLAHTESVNDENATSTLLYQLKYEGIFDNPETGVVDQRLLIVLMDVNWLRTDTGFLVDSYSVEVVEDILDDVSVQTKGTD